MTPREVATIYVVGEDSLLAKAASDLANAMQLDCKSFNSAQAFLRACGDRPGCAVIDKASVDMDLVEFFAEMRRLAGPSMVLVSQRPAMRCIVQATRLGVFMMVDKPWDDTEFGRSIREALDDDASHRARRSLAAAIRQRIGLLSDSERKVMQMIVAGETNKAIATELTTSLRTVESRRQNVFTKLGVKSVAELVRTALLVEDHVDPTAWGH